MKSAIPARLKGLQTKAGWDVMVVVLHYWGRGSSLEEACENLRKEGGNPARGSIWVYQQERPSRGTRRMAIDGMGSLCWNGERPEKIFELSEKETCAKG